MGKSIKAVLGAAVFALTASSSFASTGYATNGKITEFVVGSLYSGTAPQDLVYFKVEGMNAITCPNKNAAATHFIFDAKAPGGEAMLSFLLAAKLADRPINVAGRGSCTLKDTYEDVSHLYFAN